MDKPPPPALHRNFSVVASNYCLLIKEEAEAGSLDIEDEIDEKEYSNLPYHAICRLRKSKNAMSLYRTDSIWKWLVSNPIHPETRGLVKMAMVRIKSKVKWAKLFSGVKLADLTLSFRLRTLSLFLLDSSTANREAARAFVDVETLLAARMVKSWDYKEATKALSQCETRKWTLRFSSMHDSKKLPKCQIIVLACGSRNSKIIQKRIINVEGICYFLMSTDALPNEISETEMAEISITHCACLIDSLQVLLKMTKLKWTNFLN
jgi:hypothetical protein